MPPLELSFVIVSFGMTPATVTGAEVALAEAPEESLAETTQTTARPTVLTPGVSVGLEPIGTEPSASSHW